MTRLERQRIYATAPRRCNPSTPQRRGIVLVMVLIVVALAGMVAASLLFRIRAATAASAAAGGGQQAYAAAMSGIHQAIEIVRQHRDDTDIWYDNPDLFQNRFVCDDGANKWYFAIYAENPADRKTVRYGLTD